MKKKCVGEKQKAQKGNKNKEEWWCSIKCGKFATTEERKARETLKWFILIAFWMWTNETFFFGWYKAILTLPCITFEKLLSWYENWVYDSTSAFLICEVPSFLSQDARKITKKRKKRFFIIVDDIWQIFLYSRGNAVHIYYFTQHIFGCIFRHWALGNKSGLYYQNGLFWVNSKCFWWFAIAIFENVNITITGFTVHNMILTKHFIGFFVLSKVSFFCKFLT